MFNWQSVFAGWRSRSSVGPSALADPQGVTADWPSGRSG
jgi:hypothetical protein